MTHDHDLIEALGESTPTKKYGPVAKTIYAVLAIALAVGIGVFGGTALEAIAAADGRSTVPSENYFVNAREKDIRNLANNENLIHQLWGLSSVDEAEMTSAQLNTFKLRTELQNRHAFTRTERATAEWIREQLLSFGIEEDQIELQEFTKPDAEEFTIPWYFSEPDVADGERTEVSQNVIVTIPGNTDETVLIATHYDAVQVFEMNPGDAFDNAIGVSTALDLAQWIVDADLDYTVQIVFLGAETYGLLGSNYFFNNFPEEDVANISFMINLDVMGNGGEELNFIINQTTCTGEITDEATTCAVLQDDELSTRVENIADRLINFDLAPWKEDEETLTAACPCCVLLPPDKFMGISTLNLFSVNMTMPDSAETETVQEEISPLENITRISGGFNALLRGLLSDNRS